MNLIIKDRLISEPIINIIKQLKKECKWNVFNNIIEKNDYIRVTCPYHKDGNESHPSCSIYSKYDGDIEPYYYMKLSNNIFVHNGKCLGYGLKLFPSGTDILEQEKYSWINKLLKKLSKGLKIQ